MATKSLKRKRVVLSMKAKLAIDKIAKGYMQTSLAEEYGVGKATVSDIRNMVLERPQYLI